MAADAGRETNAWSSKVRWRSGRAMDRPQLTGEPVSMPVKLRRDVLVLAPSYVVPGIATLVSVPVLFQLLGSAGYGTYVLIFALANGVPLLTGSWLLELTFRFGHRSDAGIGPRHLLLSTALSIGGGALLAAFLIPAATATVVAVTAATTGAVGVYLITIARLQSGLRFGLVSAVSAGRAVVGAVLSIAIALATGDPAWASLGLTVGFVAASAFGLAAASRSARDHSPSSSQKSPSLLGYGAASVVGAAAMYLLSVGDRFVLSNTRTLEEVGRYAAIYGIVDLGFRLVPSVLLAAIRPRLFRAWDAGDQQRASRLITAYSSLLSWVLGLAVMAVIVLGPVFPAVPLEVAIAAPVALGLQVFVIGYGLSLVLSASLRQARLAVHVVVAAVVNLVLNVALVPRFGAPAAAIVTAITFAIYLVLNAVTLRRDGRLVDMSAVQLTSVSVAATAVGVGIAIGGQPLAGAIVGTITLAVAAPIGRAVVRGSPELFRFVRLSP